MQQPEITDIISRRKSVRTYDGRPLSPEDHTYVQALMEEVNNPFDVRVRLHLLDAAESHEKLSTYGIIRDARTYIGADCAWSEFAPLALGYQLESLVLGLTARNIASVWLGGTFKRAGFAKAMHIPGSAWFPVVLPIGYAAARPSTAERAMRRLTKADERELWRDLFTEDSFLVQLSEEAAGAYALLMAKEGDNAQIRMPSGEVRIIRTNCKACIGQVGNLEHENIQIGKAGRKRHMGWRPTVRGSVMNPCDHPHGGGEGKSPVGRPGPVTPWGKPALGYKTRKKKNPTDKFIVKRRNVK